MCACKKWAAENRRRSWAYRMGLLSKGNDMAKYRVNVNFGGHKVYEIIELDGDLPQVQSAIAGGHISLVDDSPAPVVDDPVIDSGADLFASVDTPDEVAEDEDDF